MRIAIVGSHCVGKIEEFKQRYESFGQPVE